MYDTCWSTVNLPSFLVLMDKGDCISEYRRVGRRWTGPGGEIVDFELRCESDNRIYGGGGIANDSQFILGI